MGVGVRRVGRPLYGRRLGVRPLGGPFLSGRALRGGPKTGACVWSIVLGGCGGVRGGARPLNNDDDKKEDFFRVLLAT